MHRTLLWTGKGGTGKTSSVANLGPELAYRGLRVLLVGFDSQAHLEATYGIGPDALTVVDALTGEAEPHACLHEIPLPGSTHGGTLHLLPSTRRLDDLSPALAQRDYAALDELLDVFHDDFDLALIDTVGALTPISHTAARAADTVLFVMEPGAYEALSLGERLGEIEAYREDDAWRMQPLGVIFTRTPRKSSAMQTLREHIADAENFGADIYVFEHHTRPQSSVQTHALQGRPTVLVQPDSNVGRDYRAIAGELLDRLVRLHGEQNA